MNRVFIGLGSNVGDRLAFLQRALVELAGLPQTTIAKASSVYSTEPIGVREQAEFFNAVVEIETALDVRGLYTSLKKIESSVGRIPRQRWGPREIDLDILYFNDLITSVSEIQVPHPEILNRRFVLAPLAEIAPDFIDPVHKRTIVQMLQALRDQSTVQQTTIQLERTSQ